MYWLSKKYSVVKLKADELIFQLSSPLKKDQLFFTISQSLIGTCDLRAARYPIESGLNSLMSSTMV